MESIWFLLFIILPVVAFLYASVGHGGASSYLMLLAIFGFAPEEIRPTALILNIFVSFLAFVSYRRVSKFSIRLFLSLIVFSVPAAYFGGTILVDPVLYQKILGVLLLFPVMRFLNVFPRSVKTEIEFQWWIPPLIGLSIGFISGLIGIGGGIILSPIILMLGWAQIKETAALSALFIFFNSIAGLLGTGFLQISIQPELWFLMPPTIAAGLLGAYLGAQRYNFKVLKYLLTLVLLFASIKLILS